MVRQYVGARYVPKFADPTAWTSGTSYEAMTIVTYNNSSYTSKMPVPATVGDPADNPDYWALTGNYNAQVEQYRQETENVKINYSKCFNTATNMIADTSLTEGMIVKTLGYNKIADNGGAFYKIYNTKEQNSEHYEKLSNGKYALLIPNGYVTPQMFGAVGDGVTDDTLAFQQCFDSNKKIIVPNGNYLVGACNANNNVLLELYNRAYITLKDEYFIHTTNNINIKGGRFYGESKAPDSRYYAKKVITGNLTFVNITDTHFYQCIALYQTDGKYCGFINCYNLWVYDSLFIVANKSLNYVTCVGCSFQHASNMIEATNYENISFTGCNIESVINFFSPTYADAPYNTVSITESYIECSSLFNNGRCVNIVVDKCWVYTDTTLITLNKGPGSCVFSNSTVTIISDIVLTNVINCTLILEFNVGSIKKQNTIIKADSVNLIYSGNCITKIGNQDSYYVDPTCNQITFTGKFNPEDKCLSAVDNDLYYNTGVHGLISRTKVCLALDLGKPDMLKVTPPVGTFCIEQSSHILYAYDGTVWRKCSDGTPLE